MNRDDIIRMAEEAGFEYMEYMNDSVYAGDELGSLTKFAQLVAEHEREACAKLAIELRSKQGTIGRAIACEEIADAIRARK